MEFQNLILNFEQTQMSKFAKDGNSKKKQKAITYKNEITFFLNFHQFIYSLSSISCPSLKLRTVIVFIMFSKSKFAKGNHSK